MARNYLKIAWRNLCKNQTYVLIDVLGLALGIVGALLIFALVRYHFATDTHYSWLQGFAYRITLGPSIFTIAVFATVLVAALTVSFQTIKVALMNSVKSLRSE